jgi:Domain of unknown function (DUF4384)/Putative peptidoglycan binding domain
MKTLDHHNPAQCIMRCIFALCTVLASMMLVGCAMPLSAHKDAEFQSYGYAAARPVVRPVRSISGFSESLACMDRLFRVAEVPTTLITSKQIPDMSTRVPVATKEMIITAISQMSRLSNAFRYVDYEVDISRQDTVQNLTTILLNNNQIQLQRPALYVSGAIAFVDQNVLRNQMDAGTSGSRLDTGYSNSRNATVIGLDLHLGDFRTRTLIPGLDSANEIVIGNGSQGLDFAARIGKYGVTFNMGRDYAQGSGSAIRGLAELAMIELVGKWARVPYWQCLTLEQNHPKFQQVLRDWYEESGVDTARNLIKNSLANQGYYPMENSASTKDGEDFKQALSKFQADQGIVVTGVVDFSSFERALRGFVAVGEDGHLARIGWVPVVRPTANAAASTPAVTSQAQALSIDLQIKNITTDKTSFETGQQIFASAVLGRAAYMHCYLIESEGNMVRLLPNSSQPNAQLSANQAIRIPDWMAPNPGFVLDAGSPGNEALICMASQQDPMTKLPSALKGPSFKPIAGFKGLDSIVQAYTQAMGVDGFTQSTLKWKVVPKRSTAPTTTPPAPAK